jgi:hypothetical protein
MTVAGLLLNQAGINAAYAQDNHFTIGGKIGYEKLVPMSQVSLPDTGLKRNGGFVWGVQADYQVDYKQVLLGVEIGIQYADNLSSGLASNNQQSKLSMLDLPVLATVEKALLFVEKTALQVKAGGVYTKQKCSNCAGCSGGCFRAISISKVRPMAAVAVNRAINDTLDLNLQYSHVFGSSWKSDYAGNHGGHVLTHGAFTLGFSYKVV